MWFEDAELDDSEPYLPSSLELGLPSYFTDGISNESIVNSITQDVIAESGETSGYGMANALAQHLSKEIITILPNKFQWFWSRSK